MTPEQIAALRAQVERALGAAAAAHAPSVGAEPEQREHVARVHYAPAVAPRKPQVIGPLAVRTSGDRASVPKDLRDLEGRYATALLNGESVRVLIFTVEKRSTGVKAYVTRQDNRQRCYVLPELLSDIGDDA